MMPRPSKALSWGLKKARKRKKKIEYCSGLMPHSPSSWSPKTGGVTARCLSLQVPLTGQVEPQRQSLTHFQSDGCGWLLREASREVVPAPGWAYVDCQALYKEVMAGREEQRNSRGVTRGWQGRNCSSFYLCPWYNLNYFLFNSFMGASF